MELGWDETVKKEDIIEREKEEWKCKKNSYCKNKEKDIEKEQKVRQQGNR